MREVLDAAVVRQWCRLAADALGRTRDEIDALNVFPVPDADTGTNLHLTVLAAAEAVDGLPDDADAGATWAALAQGALLGARGNSGIILSQMFRGLAEVFGMGRPPAKGVADGAALGKALAHAAGLARAAVAHPVEGTILSVLQAASDAPADGPLAAVARAAAERARAALDRTTGQLQVLAANGVVDAGGAGLCVVLDALAAVAAEDYPERYAVPGKLTHGTEQPAPAPSGGAYEVMYLLDAADDAVPALRAALDGLGDSLVVVGGDGLWNVHVHVDDAGAAVEAGIAAGRPHRIRVSHLPTGRPAADADRGVVAVVDGAGLAALFEDAGARVVLRETAADGPPVVVLLDRILEAGREVAVLPNDPEVIPVAEAAAALAREHGARVFVVPTEAAVQGLSALAVHDPVRRFDDDVIGMTHAAGATRHARLEVTSAEIIGRIAGEVTVRGTDLAQVARELLDRLLSGGGELVTLILGAGAGAGAGAGTGTGAGVADLGATLDDHLRVTHPGAEVVRYDGGQERFPLLVGVE
ncbi:MAG TPA: DAK2 domain-containing protein [Streptosporangiaceae bacterium]|nr:DAK2 domain-containing protein [Streptosporangiaceae bacterium]